MKPVYENHFETIPVEQLIAYLYFHDGVATVRDNDKMPEACQSRALYRAVESRISELRAEGYRVLSFMNCGMAQIYEPTHRRDYYLDKYGIIAFVFIIISILATATAAAYVGVF